MPFERMCAGMSHGSDAVHELIRESGWSYPVSVSRLERNHSLANVELNEDGLSLMLVELLTDVEADTFESEDDLHDKLEPVIRERIRERTPGLFGRVKRLINL